MATTISDLLNHSILNRNLLSCSDTFICTKRTL